MQAGGNCGSGYEQPPGTLRRVIGQRSIAQLSAGCTPGLREGGSALRIGCLAVWGARCGAEADPSTPGARRAERGDRADEMPGRRRPRSA